MEGGSWPVSAPYVGMAGLNLLVCDLGTHTTANTWVIPVLRFKEADSGTAGATLLTGDAVEDGLSGDFGAVSAYCA
jgi:hypothetical protein